MPESKEKETTPTYVYDERGLKVRSDSVGQVEAVKPKEKPPSKFNT